MYLWLYHISMTAQICRFYKNEDGQAILEFILLLAFAITMLTTMKVSLQKITGTFWRLLGNKIAAPCAECNAEGVSF